MIDDERLRSCLADAWGIVGAGVEVHNGGMNSTTWFVTDRGTGEPRWVAKAVAASARRSFAGGLDVAAAVEAAGIPSGAPVMARGGSFVVDVDGVPLALLRWVPGRELSGRDDDERRVIGATLARMHQALRDVSIAGAERFHWVDPRAGHLGVRPWVRPAVTAALAGYDALDPSSLSWGLLHTDPAPEAFLLEATTGVCGLIDWSTAMAGPLLYDLASAVMYVGGPGRAGPLVETYLDHGTVPRAEVVRALPAMLQFRWAVQADYFARRIVTRDLTGISGAAENEAGLASAGRALLRASARVI